MGYTFNDGCTTFNDGCTGNSWTLQDQLYTTIVFYMWSKNLNHIFFLRL